MRLLQRLSIILLIIAFFFPARATHIVGGEIGYECLGDNQYRITLTVYRDCYYGIPLFDDPSSIGFFVDTSTVALYELLIPATTSDTINYSLEDSCLSIPPDVCVEVMQFVDTIELPYQPNGYTIVYQRCCRNETLLNIQTPLETGASFVIEMTGESMLACNSSPVFNNWPPIALCVGKQLDFDHSATDADGDSIVYSLCTPYLGALHSDYGDPMPQPPEFPITTPVTWNSPYDVTNMLGGVPLSIDPVTGQLTAIPNTIGQFVIGVCIREFRDGVLMSETKRDFQFNVSDCGEIVSSFFIPETLCDTLGVSMDNLSKNAEWYHWDFGVSGTDLDTSNLYNPIFIFPDTGSYDITLIAARTETCIDTFEKKVVLQNSTFDIDMDWQVIGCDDSIRVKIIDQTVDSVFEIADWKWVFSNDNGSVFSNNMDPYFVLPSGENTVLHGVLKSSNGCEKELDFSFPYAVVGDLIAPDVAICQGLDVGLNPGGLDSFYYEWSPADGLDDANAVSPIVKNVQSDISYSVVVTGLDSVCSRAFDVDVSVFGISVLATANPDTILAGEMSQLLANGSDVDDYEWTPPEDLNNSNIANPIAAPTETTDYQLVVKNDAGCMDSVTVRIIVLNPTCAFPYIFVPSGFTPNGDGQNDQLRLYGDIVESMHLMVFDRWGEKVFETKNQHEGWDGTYKGKELAPDVYGFWVQVKCINGEVYTKKGNVTLIR